MLTDLNHFIQSTDVILLAAGTSSRMGEENKLLLKHNNKSLIQHSVEQLQQLPFNQIIIVTGYQDTELGKQLELSHSHTVIHNPEYKSGQTSSIQTGLQKLADQSKQFMICLSDMPFLQHSHIRDLLSFTHQQNASICRPFVKDIPGHPVVFQRSYAKDLLSCEDKDGCRSVIKQHAQLLVRYESEDSAYIKDIDVQEDKGLLF